MIRFLNVYYPARTLILMAVDTLIVWASFLLATWYAFGRDSYLVRNVEYGRVTIVVYILAALLLCHYFDLYDTSRLITEGDWYFRVLLVPGLMALVLALVAMFWPKTLLGHYSSLIGLVMLTVGLLGWRMSFCWLVRLTILIERVYVLGMGARAQRLVQGLRQNSAIGVEVASWTGELEGAVTRDSVAAHLLETIHKQRVRRVIIAMPERRGAIPVNELFNLWVHGVKIEEATSWLEKTSGKIEVENLYPSWLMFSGGLPLKDATRWLRRFLDFVVAVLTLMVAALFVPFIALAIRLDSSGSVFYRQKRVGRGERIFYCYKFRTMHQDSEANTGPTSADNGDPRITRVGRFLRISRLAEIPQLWCVLKGDMAFVGPRPECPEFVEWLKKEIPYYGMRHLVRPGITGWAQIKYGHHSTVEDLREELQYDLFYMKNASIGLDLLIMLRTIKMVLLLRGEH